MDEINNTWYKQKDIVLASRMSRLWASLIDYFVLIVLVFEFWYAWVIVAFEKNVFVKIVGIIAIFAVLVIYIYQIVLQSKYGQTIGKKLLKIRIVDVKTGENGGFFKNVILRSGVNSLISIIPIYPLIDILFIFGEDRRCLHDRIAGTKVIKV